ncbi:MAG: hypothetical protein IJ867_02640 [Clostridia bacterium]|nr:hypothetical protein [Clostridia bacterium]
MKQYTLNLFTESKEKLQDFFQKYDNETIELNNQEPNYEKDFGNPVDMIEMISTLIDNNEKYPVGIWISIDKNIFINVSEQNLDKIIRYLLERYPN